MGNPAHIPDHGAARIMTLKVFKLESAAVV